MELTGRTAFITGGAQGIGLGIARRLSREGVKLALADIDAAALDAAQDELTASTDVKTYVLDVRDREAFASVADEVESQQGPVSLLFNNAGVAGATPVTEMTYEMWDWVLGINLHGVINGIQTFLPRMIARGEGGHVVNTSSGAGIAPTGSGHLYHTSKYAVVGLSESLRQDLEYARIGIGISVLCPGPVATNIVARTIANRPGRTPAENDHELTRVREMSAALAAGVSPDEVGDMVWNGIKSNSPYIFTDRVMADLVIDRTEALMAAMPVDTDDTDEPAAEHKGPIGSLRERPKRKMRSFAVSADIPASPAEVFAVITDFSRAGEWTKGHVGLPDGPPDSLQPGASFVQRVDSMGSTTDISWTLTDVHTPTTLGMEGAGPMGTRLSTQFSLEPSGDSTALTVTTEMGGGLMIGPIGKTAIKNARENQLESLQKLQSLFAW